MKTEVREKEPAILAVTDKNQAGETVDPADPIGRWRALGVAQIFELEKVITGLVGINAHPRGVGDPTSNRI
ncbi:MAG TPA: hypothetical protein PKX00_10020, partial [Opitutaceae bacterium]|nr:hypothetical protein [Opitutaceae bacterium]